jgi:activator of HSP90 ATPase
MAKLGEGDSRWIVTDRPDGTNCGNWHWQEKDLTATAHDAVKNKFKGLVMHEADGLTVTAKEVSDITGDVTVAQRKGKIMCYFDIKLTLKYTVKADGETGEGKVMAPEIDHDSFRGDFELNVTATDAKAASKKGEQWMRQSGRDQIRSFVRDYFNEIFVQHNVGKYLTKVGPAAGSPPGTVTPTASSPATPGTTSPAPSTAAPAAPPAAAPKPKPQPPANKSSLTWKLEWRCPVEELWMVLTDEGRASHYTRAPAKVNPQPSGSFEYLGGLISGYFVDVVPREKLVLQWRLSSWQSGQFSSVIMNFSREEAGVCRLEFAQAGIPDGEYERVRDGWLRNFWDPIKAVFGFNYEVL